MKISTETIHHVISLANDCEQASEAYIVKYFPSRAIPFADAMKYDDTEEAKKRTSTYDALVNFLRALSFREVAELQAIMLFGRGDSGSLEQNIAEAISSVETDEQKYEMIAYVADKSPLAKYLTAALKKM